MPTATSGLGGLTATTGPRATGPLRQHTRGSTVSRPPTGACGDSVLVAVVGREVSSTVVWLTVADVGERPRQQSMRDH